MQRDGTQLCCLFSFCIDMRRAVPYLIPVTFVHFIWRHGKGGAGGLLSLWNQRPAIVLFLFCHPYDLSSTLSFEPFFMKGEF